MNIIIAGSLFLTNNTRVHPAATEMLTWSHPLARVRMDCKL